MARPKEEDEILSIRLAKKHVSMLDAHVTNELMRTAPLRPDGMPTPKTIANARRRFLGQLIEDSFSLEAQHPTELKIVAPIVGPSVLYQEAEKWVLVKQAELEEQAPAAIKIALQSNQQIREHEMARQDAENKS